MSGLGIEDLGWPTAPYRVDLDDGHDFETRQFSRDEDAFRAHSAYSVGDTLELFEREEARRLGRLLDYGPEDDPPNSLASSLYMRDHRIRLPGHLWKWIEEHPDVPVATFTTIAEGLKVDAAELDRLNPIQAKAALRADLNRRGATDAQGWIAAGFHCEFEPESGTYQGHGHGVTAGEMVKVVDDLRNTPKYRSSRKSEDKTQRLTMSRQPLTDLPYPITYILQSWWPSKRVGLVGSGQVKRNRQKARIPEPFHTQYLLWLDRWRLSDMVLLMGMSVGRDGICFRD